MMLATGVVVELQDAMFGKKLRFVLEEKGDHNSITYSILLYDTAYNSLVFFMNEEFLMKDVYSEMEWKRIDNVIDSIPFHVVTCIR